MKRYISAFFLLFFCTAAWATNSHQLGSEARERMAWWYDAHLPWVSSGCLPSVPSSSLTLASFTCAAYVSDGTDEMVYVSETSVITIADATPTWLAICQDRTSTVTGWTRQSLTHFVYKQSAAQPQNPGGCLVFSKVTVAASVISRVDNFAYRSPVDATMGKHNIKSWGAVADASTTDNATAIENAWKAASLNGGVVFIDGEYRFDSRLDFDTQTTQREVIVECNTKRYSALYYYGSQDPAIKIGVDSTTNSGFTGIQGCYIDGANGVAEVDGVEVYSGSRHTVFKDVTIRNFYKGRALYIKDTILTHWSNIQLLNSYQAIATSGLIDFEINTLVIENSGPFEQDCGPSRDGMFLSQDWSAYTNPNIALGSPGADLRGTDFIITNYTNETSQSITPTMLTGQVHIYGFYHESNVNYGDRGAGDLGNEVELSGQGAIIQGGYIAHGVCTSSPCARYMFNMGDSVNARISGINVPQLAAPDQNNVSYGIDFSTSTGAIVDIDFNIYDGIAQRLADFYTYTRGTGLGNFTLNGKRYIGGMLAKDVAHLLLTTYNEIPAKLAIMQAVDTSGNPEGFTVTGGTTSAMTQTNVPWGWPGWAFLATHTSAMDVYYNFAAGGGLTASNKYYITMWLRQDSASNLSYPYTLEEGGSVQQFDTRIGLTFIGWQRFSTIQTFTDPAANYVRIGWQQAANKTTYGKGLFVVDLTAFDAVYGTSLASMSVLELDSFIDPNVLSGLFRQESFQAAPTTGTCAVGDISWYSTPTAAGKIGAVCTGAGSPGTWKEFGAIDA